MLQCSHSGFGCSKASRCTWSRGQTSCPQGALLPPRWGPRRNPSGAIAAQPYSVLLQCQPGWVSAAQSRRVGVGGVHIIPFEYGWLSCSAVCLLSTRHAGSLISTSLSPIASLIQDGVVLLFPSVFYLCGSLHVSYCTASATCWTWPPPPRNQCISS